jgi:hypothetical protein
MTAVLSRPRRVLAVSTLALGALAVPATAQAAPGGSPFTFAVIGDIPYGAAEIASFPANIAQINDDPSVQFVAHLGDIKNGSSTCDDAYFAQIRTDFDLFQDPLVYTVGDNEWTDCHRPNNGGYNPLERLAAVRDVFFDRPGHTLGQQSVGVQSQADRGIPENVSWTRAGVRFAAVDVVGSNNGLAPWTGHTSATPEQVAEEHARMAATIDLVNQTFDRAQHGQAVVLMLQADMFDPTVTNPQISDYSAFQPLVQTIAARAAAHDGSVYLFNGDSHVYNGDHPLASGSQWLSFYGVTTPADNLTRITVDGSDNAHDYLRVRVDHGRHGEQTLTWERVPLAAR